MKTLKLSAFILAAVLFLGFGTTTLSAQSSGEIVLDGKSLNIKSCQGTDGCTCTDCKCDTKKSKSCDCAKCSCSSSAKGTMKCGAGKCGAAMKAPKATMKCGAGKCGSN